MPPQSLAQPERDVLIVLATLEQVPGSMPNELTFGNGGVDSVLARTGDDLRPPSVAPASSLASYDEA